MACQELKDGREDMGEAWVETGDNQAKTSARDMEVQVSIKVGKVANRLNGDSNNKVGANKGSKHGDSNRDNMINSVGRWEEIWVVSDNPRIWAWEVMAPSKTGEEWEVWVEWEGLWAEDRTGSIRIRSYQ